MRWLKQCDQTGTLPWEYDFEEEIFSQKPGSLPFSKDPIKRFLEKKEGFYGRPSCETEDCPLMQAIYWVLWGTYSKNVTLKVKGDCDADVMNSFWSIFKIYLRSTYTDFFKNAQCIHPKGLFPNKGKFSPESKLLFAYKGYGAKEGSSWFSIIRLNYDGIFKKFEDSNLQKVAAFSHTLGNFTLTPQRFNSIGVTNSNNTNEHHKGIKHNDQYNTWSNALHELKKLDWASQHYLNCDSWDHYCRKFFMEDYKEEYSYERSPGKQEEFLSKIYLSIENRGKHLIKELCDKLNSKNFDFYRKYLLDLN